jgi:hypothetical protein
MTSSTRIRTAFRPTVSTGTMRPATGAGTLTGFRHFVSRMDFQTRKPERVGRRTPLVMDLYCGMSLAHAMPLRRAGARARAARTSATPTFVVKSNVARSCTEVEQVARNVRARAKMVGLTTRLTFHAACRNMCGLRVGPAIADGECRSLGRSTIFARDSAPRSTATDGWLLACDAQRCSADRAGRP